MSFVNLGGIWTVVLVGLVVRATSSRLAAGLLGAASAWAALGFFYSTLLPRLPHEVFWFVAGVCAVTLGAVLLARADAERRRLAAGLALAAEPLIGLGVGLGRNGVARGDVVVWPIELLVGLALIAWVWVGRQSRAPS